MLIDAMKLMPWLVWASAAQETRVSNIQLLFHCYSAVDEVIIFVLRRRFH